LKINQVLCRLLILAATIKKNRILLLLINPVTIRLANLCIKEQLIQNSIKLVVELVTQFLQVMMPITHLNLELVVTQDTI
jgi:hypothetical protein